MAMTKEQILKSIERAELALGRTDREGAKAVLKKQLDQMKSDLAALEKETVKKEEKIEEKEQAAKEDFDADIAKFEALLKRNPGAKIREVFEKKLKEAKRKKAEMEAEAKQDKAEAKQELKEVKEAVKDIEKAVATGSTEPIKKPKIEEKKREDKSKKRIKTMQQTITSLSTLVDKVKELKEKYVTTPSGRVNVDLKRDAGRPAKPFGYRFTGKGKNAYRVPTPAEIKLGKKRGTIDYEGRPNRSDVYPKGYKGNVREKLAAGGTLMAKMSNGGGVKTGDLVWLVDNDGIVEPLQVSTYKTQLKSFKKSDNWKQTVDEENRKVFVSADGKSKTTFRKKFVYADGGMFEKPIPAFYLISDDGYEVVIQPAYLRDEANAFFKKRMTLDEIRKLGTSKYNAFIHHLVKKGYEKKDGNERNVKVDESASQKAAAISEAVEIATKANAAGIKASYLTFDEFCQEVSKETKRSYGVGYLRLAYEAMKSAGYADGGSISKKELQKKMMHHYQDPNSKEYQSRLKEAMRSTQAPKKKKAKFDYDEEALTGERAGERKAEMGYADGGGIDPISKKDVLDVAKSLKKNLTEEEVKEVIEMYPSEEENDPGANWREIVENCIYQLKSVRMRELGKGKMAKGGKLVGKQANLDMNKNGRLDKEDFQILRGKKKKMAKGGKTMRKNSPHRFCWTKDAVKDGIIKPADMNKTPSRYQRKNYPAYIMEK